MADGMTKEALDRMAADGGLQDVAGPAALMVPDIDDVIRRTMKGAGGCASPAYQSALAPTIYGTAYVPATVSNTGLLTLASFKYTLFDHGLNEQGTFQWGAITGNGTLVETSQWMQGAASDDVKFALYAMTTQLREVVQLAAATTDAARSYPVLGDDQARILRVLADVTGVIVRNASSQCDYPVGRVRDLIAGPVGGDDTGQQFLASEPVYLTQRIGFIANESNAAQNARARLECSGFTMQLGTFIPATTQTLYIPVTVGMWIARDKG